MAATWTEQYRAISNRETAGEDGLSVRAIRDLADGLNNWARWGGGREKVISEICLPAWASKDTSNTDENVIAVFAPRLIPHGFTKFSVTVGHERTSGSSMVDWDLYASSQIYLGDVILDTTALSADYDSVRIAQTSSGTHAITVSQTLELPASVNISTGVFFVLTAENTSGNQAQITSLDVTPIYV